MNTRLVLVALASALVSSSALAHGSERASASAMPLIFSLRAARPLTALLASGKVGADTSYLVRQGSASWWRAFSNAYDALASLDTDNDGWLSGTELKGLGVWRDRNRDGVCDANEVTTVTAAGIEAIATRATSKAGVSPANPTGIVLKSGRTLPTYNWVR